MQPLGECLLLVLPRVGKCLRVRIERDPSPNSIAARQGVRRGRHLRNQREAIEQLRPEATFLRIHAAHEHEPSLLPRAESLAFDHVYPTRTASRSASAR